MNTLKAASLAMALTATAIALAPAASQAASHGSGMKNIAPVTQAARATGAQGVNRAAVGSKRRCKFVSTPYPHLECSF